MGVGFVPLVVLLGLSIPLLAIATPILIVWLVLRAASGRSGKQGERLADETRIMQEIHQGLEQMAQRIDNLEALLVERQTRDDTAETSR